MRPQRTALISTIIASLALAVVLSSCGGDDAAPASPTVAPFSGAGSQGTSTPPPKQSSTPTATKPPALATPTARALPTPVLAGFPTIPLPAASPDREIVDAINRNGPAYSAAMSKLDESFLATVFTGEALDAYAKEVADARAKSQPGQDALLEIHLVSLTASGSSATVNTSERWRFQVGNSCNVYSYDEFYQLALINGLWFIAKNQFVETASGPC